MSRKRYTPEQIISMLREAEVALSQGQTVVLAYARQWLRPEHQLKPRQTLT